MPGTMTQSDTKSGGNTKPQTSSIKSRRWCFTWNNYTEENVDTLTRIFQLKKWKNVIGRETGESGTPHLQGYIEAKNAIRFETLKKLFPKVHWEKAKGSADDNLAYCTKEGNAVTNIAPSLKVQYNQYMEKTYTDIKWYDWQQEVLDILATEPNTRDIYWFWEPVGNKGKSFMTKYINWKFNTVIVNGKQSDVFNGIKTFLDTEKVFPQVAIVDIPRSNKNYVCYGTMEKIKDGLAYSGKYEGGKLELLPLHMIVFANFEPNLEEMSADRWHIREL